MLKERTWKKRIHQGWCFGEYPDKKLKKYNKHKGGVVFEYGICNNFGVYFRVFSAKPKQKGVRSIKYKDALELRVLDVKRPKFENLPKTSK